VRLFIGALLVLSLGANVALAYRIFDLSISLDHARQESRARKVRSAQVLDVVRALARSASREQIAAVASESSRKGVVVKADAQAIQIGDLVFSFPHGTPTAEYID
jgi:hypothetical protein